MALRADDTTLLPPPTTAEAATRHLELVPGPVRSDAALEVETLALFAGALGQTIGSTVNRPARALSSIGRLAGGVAGASVASVRRAVGQSVDGPVELGRDHRFADPTWDDNAAYWWVRQMYLLNSRFVNELLEAAPMSAATKGKASFFAGVTLDALAPTNTLPGNPAALKRALETGGLSVVKGLRNLVGDLRKNGGWPSQVDTEAFEVGTDMAATPGRVVYRNDLMELIQYEPRTEQVHEIPLIFCPPWINKYYIMDLAPGRSLVEWALDHGHTCFAISYRNPDSTPSDASFSEYLHDGPLTAIEVVRSITGAEKVNTLAVCLGGTLSAMAMALDAAEGRDDVNSATFINTHTDFTRPGLLGAFTDEATVDVLCRYLGANPSLSARYMQRTFSLLRANDLVFRYVVSGWLKGEAPPAFDLLAWNEDGTDMPARLHSEFIRACYVENRFAEGRMEIDDVVLDPAAVTVPSYVVSAVDDHIVPWQSAYQTTQVLGSDDMRFVLSTSGHIAAIVNPPSPKAKFWSNDSLPSDEEEWLEGAELHEATWWQDWAEWIDGRAGGLVAAPTILGDGQHPPLESAPGTYVLA